MSHSPADALENSPTPPEEAAEAFLAQPNTTTNRGLRRYMLLIGTGLFVTTIAQPRVIGNLPFLYILKNQMHLHAEQIAVFWAISNFAWYIKPLAGLLCDSIPLFGTRRRSYLLLSGLFGTLLWMMYGFLPRAYSPFLWLTVALSVVMVVASTVTGGLLVEEGQKYGATGRLSSIRSGIDSVISLIVGPLGGILAAHAFGWTVGIGTALLFSLVPATWFLLHEPPVATRNTAVWGEAWQQLKNIARSRTMWAAALLFFFVYIAPGFATPFFFYQTDTLKFSPTFIGNLGFISGVGGLLGALAYGYYCRKFTLRPLMYIGILFNVASTLFYLGYKSPNTAIAIEFGNGLFSTMAALPLFDLAARATPKGSEGFGYALMMSVRNITLIAISDVLGSYLYDKYHIGIMQLVWINAGTTALVLLFIPFLPKVLMNQKDD